MAKITSNNGKPPKRFDGYVTYPIENGTYVMKRKSGFTGKGLRFDSKYAHCRFNSSEFGRVSKLGKAIRNTLVSHLPKSNNLAVCNQLTSTLRKVMLCDSIHPLGERTVYEGLRTNEGKDLLVNYSFNPSTCFSTIFKGSVNFDLDKQLLELAFTPQENGCIFPEGADYISLQLGYFAINEWAEVSTNHLGELILFTKDHKLKTIIANLPEATENSGVLIYYMVAAFYVVADGSYLPYLEDSTKVIEVLGVV